MHDDTETSFESLVRPELVKLYRLAYRLTGHSEDAEDLVQEVIVKAYDRRRELSSIESLGGWLARVMFNQFIDDVRRQKRDRLRIVSIDSDDATGRLASAVPSEEATPSVAWERGAIRDALGAALAALSLEHRTVVLMHDAEGYTLEEIQRITGIPIGTVKSRLHRARARLRELLDSAGTF